MLNKCKKKKLGNDRKSPFIPAARGRQQLRHNRLWLRRREIQTQHSMAISRCPKAASSTSSVEKRVKKKCNAVSISYLHPPPLL